MDWILNELEEEEKEHWFFKSKTRFSKSFKRCIFFQRSSSICNVYVLSCIQEMCREKSIIAVYKSYMVSNMGNINAQTLWGRYNWVWYDKELQKVFKLKNMYGQPINEMNSSWKCLYPVFERKSRLSKKGDTSFYYMLMHIGRPIIEMNSSWKCLFQQCHFDLRY